MTSQIRDRARSAHHHPDGRDTDGLGVTNALTAALTEQARETAVANTHELQDAVLGLVRQGQNATPG